MPLNITGFDQSITDRPYSIGSPSQRSNFLPVNKNKGKKIYKFLKIIFQPPKIFLANSEDSSSKQRFIAKITSILDSADQQPKN